MNEFEILSAAGWPILPRGRFPAYTINDCAMRQEQSGRTSS